MTEDNYTQYDVEKWDDQCGGWMTLESFTDRNDAMFAHTAFVVDDLSNCREGCRYRLVITSTESL